MDIYGKAKRPAYGQREALRGVGRLGKALALVRIQNPLTRLDYAKREIVAARFFENPTATVVFVGKQNFPGGSNA